MELNQFFDYLIFIALIVLAERTWNAPIYLL
jgi:hypothetical protein